MSVILSGPKRLYVLLLFWQQLADPCAACPWAPQGRGAEQNGCGPLCRIVMAVRFHRIFWNRLIGLSLLIFELPPSSHGRGAAGLSERGDADFW